MLRAIITHDGHARILKDVPPWKCSRTVHTSSTELRYHMSRKGPKTNEWPLFDINVSNSKKNIFRIHFSISLFLVDGMSEQIFRREIELIYKKMTLPPISITFRDYSSAIQNIKNHREFHNSLKYWQNRIPTLPTAPAVPTKVSPNVGVLDVSHYSGRLSAKKWQNLLKNQKLSMPGIGVTSTALLLSVYSESLSRWSNQKHFLINVMHTLRHDVSSHPLHF
jgi:hypothetical protein